MRSHEDSFLVGPYHTTGRRSHFLLVATALIPRRIEAFGVGTSTSQTLIKLVEVEVFSRQGYPKAILSDNGPQFDSTVYRDADGWQKTLWTTPIRYPRANPTERRNQDLKKGLRLHLYK